MTAAEGRLLVVEDDPDLVGIWTRSANAWGYTVRSATTLRDAIALLSWQPRLIVLDIHLPDGSGLDLATRCLHVRPRPLIVATTGLASRDDVFALSKLGVRELLEKPFLLHGLKDALRRAVEAPREFRHFIAASVEHISLPDLQRVVREELLAEAMARTSGNISQAARILGMTRQAVQQALRSLQRCAASGMQENLRCAPARAPRAWQEEAPVE